MRWSRRGLWWLGAGALGGVAVLGAACAGNAPPQAAGSTSPSPTVAAVSPGASSVATPPATATGPACPANGQAVSTAAQLTKALSSARPGSVITLAAGTYSGHFVATTSGTAEAPIVLCGHENAVIDGGDIKAGYALHLNGASWWHVVGITVQDGQKGVMTDHANHVTLSDMHVHDIGDEAVHLRSASSDNTVERLVIRRTGLLTDKFGEGIYVGSAHSNWCKYSACGPDTSDRNVLRNNDISETTAENIDIKEGTTGGVIADNRLSGVGMVHAAATAWVNVKGNRWTVTGNVGVKSIKDGFQVHKILDGWGEDDVFRGNTASVDGPGFGFYVQSRALRAQVACDNVANGAGAGLSNLGCS